MKIRDVIKMLEDDGWAAVRQPKEEIQREMKDAIAFHLDGLREEGLAIPEPHSSSSYVDIPA
ncbi:MAG: hypothetical protein DMF84_31070 [Acidobacteria bacterium]|nr:MAG: hypothetical protein DMF84_31070 [Acidobacteriota bacterium]